MEKVTIYSKEGKKTEKVDLPIQFLEPVRFDIIKKAISVSRSNRRKRYGSDPRAGTKQGGEPYKRRNRYRTIYGRGASRIKRKFSFQRGTQFGWIGAFVANTVSGRRAFPPKSERKFCKRMNKKENKKAIRSALAANIKVLKIVDNKVENLKRTKEVKKLLKKIGLAADYKKKKRAGKGTIRGRKEQNKKSILTIVSKDTPVLKSSKNLSNLQIIKVNNLTAESLCPGGNPRETVLCTKKALETLKKERLYI